MPIDLFENPEGTREEILAAAYRALCEHGYADLTIGTIGQEFEKSPSLVYHYYEGKDELLVDFLEFMLDGFETSVPDREFDDAHEQLQALIDHVFPDDLEDERRGFSGAMLQLRAQAVQDPAYANHFTRSDRFFQARLVSIVERGIEEGVFREVDPEAVAAFLLTAINGAMYRRVTADVDESIPAIREEIRTYVARRLLAEGGELTEATPDVQADR